MQRPPDISRRALLVGVSALGLLAACGGSDPVADDPRPLTEDEANLLAVTRFQTHRRGLVAVEMDWPGDPAGTIEADVDFTTVQAYGTLRTTTTSGAAATSRYIGWNTAAVTTADRPESAEIPGPEGWSARALRTSVPSDLFLGLVLNLGVDRPENALLLRQSSARFLRTDRVGDVEVSVIQGPRPAGDERQSRTRYWIDADGDLRRFEAYLGDAGGRPARATLTSADPQPSGLSDAVAVALRGPSAR